MTLPLAGVNLPVLLGAYGHDLATNPKHPDWSFEISPLLAYRYLSMCRVMGFRAVRIWLCENGEGVLTDDRGRIVGVDPDLVNAVHVLHHGASLGNLQIYWSFLDANAWQHDRCAVTRSVASDPEQATRFSELVAAPLADAMDPKTVFGLEVFNEPESLTTEVLGDDGLPWSSLTDAIRTVRRTLRQVQPDIPVTSGSQAVFLPRLAADGDLPVDAVDLHIYHRTGGMPAREELPVDIGDRPLWAGECGTSHEGEEGCTDYLLNYLFNARKLGYDAAFLWKLEGDLVRWRPHEDREGHGFEMLPLGERVQALLRSDWRT